jgi:hypothetical protein
MKRLLLACVTAIPLAAVAWGMGNREVIHEYDYPRERVIEKEKVIYRDREVKHKDWERCKDQSHHHPPAPQHHDAPQHRSSGGQSSGEHHKKK